MTTKSLAVLLFSCSLLLGCIDLADEPSSPDESEAEAALVYKPPVFQLAAPNHLLWIDVNGNARVQRYSTLIGLQQEWSYSQPWPYSAAGIAGDRLLWNDGAANAVLWKLDDRGAKVSQRTLSAPVPGAFYPVSLSLAPLAVNDCWQRSDEQRYFLMWNRFMNGERFGEAAIQLIDGSGHVYRTVFVTLPTAGVEPIWFGRGRDGYDRLVLRDLGVGSQVTSYRAELDATSPVTYRLSGVAFATAPSGHRAMSSGWVVSTLSVARGTYDQLLFSSRFAATDGGRGQLSWYTAPWTPVHIPLTGNDAITPVSGGNGWYARAFTGNPAECR